MPALHQRGSDSITEFEAAAAQRCEEARRLTKVSYHLGAVYLYGYSVEMRIKALFFRNSGFRPDQIITQDDRRDALDMYLTLGLLARPGQHDIAGWANLAVAARATTARPYPTGAGQLGQEIVNRATQIYLILRETLRYRATRPTTAEHRAVRQIAEWFEAGYAKMI